MKLAVVVCARIGSGKSTAVNFITAEFGFKAVSFGSSIRHMAALRSTPTTRGQLQDLGDCVFKSKGPSGFLEEALEHFGINSHDSVVFDGVRHLEILTAIRQAAEATIAVYLEVNQEERFRRHPGSTGFRLVSGGVPHCRQPPGRGRDRHDHRPLRSGCERSMLRYDRPRGSAKPNCPERGRLNLQQ